MNLVERQVQLDVLEILELLLGVFEDLGFGAQDRSANTGLGLAGFG